MSDALATLLLPFTDGALPPPAPGRGFFLRAEPSADLPPGLLCVQTFKPTHDALQRQGASVVTDLPGEGYDVGLCLLTKHKIETYALLGQAWRALKVGGTLIAAGSNDIGAGSYAKAVKAVVGPVLSMSKHHGKVFWAVKTGEHAEMTAWAEAGVRRHIAAIDAWSEPGLYNWDSVDKGSALLAEVLPADLGGRVADVGAGWGYLSRELLRRCPAVESLDLFEAEQRALQAAVLNLEGARVPVTAHWHDVAGGLPRRAFDAVVMNPPFHIGKATDLDLGRAFINHAAEAVAPHGRLILVANRHLPYEAVVEAKLGRFRLLAEDAAYKVIEARRGRL